MLSDTCIFRALLCFELGRANPGQWQGHQLWNRPTEAGITEPRKLPGGSRNSMLLLSAGDKNKQTPPGGTEGAGIGASQPTPHTAGSREPWLTAGSNSERLKSGFVFLGVIYTICLAIDRSGKWAYCLFSVHGRKKCTEQGSPRTSRCDGPVTSNWNQIKGQAVG